MEKNDYQSQLAWNMMIYLTKKTNSTLTVLLLRRVRILCLEGVLSSSSGTGLNKYWLGLVLKGGDSTPDSSPYFLYDR